VGQVLCSEHFILFIRPLASPPTHQAVFCVQQAVDWIEYAIATGPEPFLWTREISMPWWQLQYLDVAGLAAAALAVGIVLVRWCLRRWLRQKEGLTLQGKRVKTS
jgi:hypothetical protein